MDLREELTTKILTTLQTTYNDLDITDVRNKLVFILSDYNVDKACTALVATDIHEKLHLFLAVKKLKGIKNGSLENYRNTIVDFSRYIHKPVDQVTTMDIRKYLAVYYDKVKATTLNSKLSKIRGFFDWLYTDGYIQNNPAKNVEPIKTESRIRKGLTLEQMELLRACCNTKREKALLEFLYATGCRVSEIVGIKISDLDFNEMSLYVVGKGSKERKVYFNERAKVILREYLSTRRDDCPHLFVTHRKPVKRIERHTILKELASIGERMNPPINVFPHLIRHTFATHSVNAGIPIEVVQQLLGHATPATTIIYAKLNDTKIKQEYRKL